jgi:antitoxin HigA-1
MDAAARDAVTMPMKNPPHPGEVIRHEVIEALGLTVSKAAEILDVRRATLSDVTNGKASLTAEMALRLEKAFGVSMDMLLRMQAGYDAAQMRRRADEIEVQRFVPVEAAPA